MTGKAIGVYCCDATFATYGEADRHELEHRQCLVCGSTKSLGEARNLRTGQIERFEEWYPLRDRHTDEVIGYQCQRCFDRD